jgi:hypothetical protein
MFFEGEEGIKEVYQDTLRYPDGELLAWVTDKAYPVLSKKYLEEEYLPKRVQKKISVRAVVPDTPEMRQYAGRDAKSLRQTKIAKAQNFSVEVEINLYGGRKIAVMAFEEKMGLIIESQKLFKTLKSIFELSWLFLDSDNSPAAADSGSEAPVEGAEEDRMFNEKFLEGR